MTHHIGQTPRQLQARDLSSNVPSSGSTQSRSTSSSGTVFDYRKAKKDRVQPKRGGMGRTWEMAGGLRRVDEPSMAATRESTTTAVNAGTRAEGPSSKENREPEGWSGQSPPVDPLDGGWGGANTTQQNQGGWGEENSSPGASSAW